MWVVMQAVYDAPGLLLFSGMHKWCTLMEFKENAVCRIWIRKTGKSTRWRSGRPVRLQGRLRRLLWKIKYPCLLCAENHHSSRRICLPESLHALTAILWLRLCRCGGCCAKRLLFSSYFNFSFRHMMIIRGFWYNNCTIDSQSAQYERKIFLELQTDVHVWIVPEKSGYWIDIVWAMFKIRSLKIAVDPQKNVEMIRLKTGTNSGNVEKYGCLNSRPWRKNKEWNDWNNQQNGKTGQRWLFRAL